MGVLRYPFDTRRFCQAVAYLLARCGPKTRGEIGKLLYFADRYHYVRYGRPVVGGPYNALPWGPVPSVAIDILEDLERSAIDTQPAPPQVGPGFVEALKSYVTVTAGQPYSIYSVREGAPRTHLSESDIEALESVSTRYCSLNFWQLSSLSHEHAAQKKTPEPDEIDYLLFFEDEPGASNDVKSYVMMHEEAETAETQGA
ncbi:MAG: Panacea domain-containing protein [Candidatus Coatesbacteria bacterium]